MRDIGRGLTALACMTIFIACHGARGTDPKLERGEYLSKILGCKYCHAAVGASGPDFSHPFAGGFEVQEKLGTWRAPNITQDPRTGIGAWTDTDIATAIREGVRPDGTHLYPIMPYLNFNRLTDDDLNALIAYLRTVPGVNNAVATNTDLALPRPLAPEPTNAADVVADPVKHGEYLVTIMNCGMCHTPLGPDGMPDVTRQFAGGVEIEIPKLGAGTLYSSNITSDPDTGIGTWTDAELEQAVRVPGVGGGRIELYLTGKNPMAEVDLAAIVAYLKTIPPVKNAVPKSDFRTEFAKSFGRSGNDGRDRTVAHVAELPVATAQR
jgi:mono/diheme cytochrome c family protein